MRIAVIGAGGLGAVVAAASSLSPDHEVSVCVRTPIESLVLEHHGDERELPVRILSEPEAVDTAADVVWLTTKIDDIPGTAPWLSRLCTSSTLVAAAQNGLDHRAHVARFVPAGEVAPALAYMAAERISPGRVRYMAGDRIVVPAGDVEERLTAAIVGSNLVIRGVHDITTAAWQKLLGNLVANPITALTMRRIEVMKSPGITELAHTILAEAAQVAAAEGVKITEADIEATIAGTGRYGIDTGSSMLYDRLAGRPMEHAYLTGEVVRRAALHGIAVPVNSAILALLDAVDPARPAPGMRSPAGSEGSAEPESVDELPAAF